MDPSGGGIALVDQLGMGGTSISTALQSQWTQGATVLNVPPVSPSGAPGGARPWSLQAVGFTGYLQWGSTFGQGNATFFGRFGRLIGGIALGSDNVESTSGYYHEPGGGYADVQIPSNSPMLPLPNPNLSTVVWDPDTDEMPAYGTIGGGYRSHQTPFTASLQLPNPVDLLPGETLGVGLWLTPSLIGAQRLDSTVTEWELAVIDALYTLTFDDGSAG